MEPNDYIEVNRSSWNKRTDYHVKSDFYDLDGFLKGNTSLNSIELELLGDIKGKSILHLQCHFGQDSLSLGRLGAEVTGVDLSDKSIEKAKELSSQTGIEAEFICCDIYDLPKYLDKKFDIVYTSYGVITWLPDMNKWSAIISQFLKPNGKFVFVEFHPVMWMFNDDFNEISYNYFNSGAIAETETGTYADTNAAITQDSIMWNHSIGEVLTSLINGGIVINEFKEFDYSPYNCFNYTVEFEPKKYRIMHLKNKIPMIFAIVGTKNV